MKKRVFLILILMCLSIVPAFTFTIGIHGGFALNSLCGDNQTLGISFSLFEKDTLTFTLNFDFNHYGFFSPGLIADWTFWKSSQDFSVSAGVGLLLNTSSWLSTADAVSFAVRLPLSISYRNYSYVQIAPSIGLSKRIFQRVPTIFFVIPITTGFRIPLSKPLQ